MQYNFFLVSKEDAKDGTKIGYKYAIANKNKWIGVDGTDLSQYLTIGFVKGCDYVVYDDVAYGIMKSYIDLSEGSVVMVCVESVAGCDIKKVFNNIDNSSIIIDKSKDTNNTDGSESDGN